MTAAAVLGVYGGRFDPFHLCHREVARRALADLPLTRLLVIPNGAPPHQEVAVTWADRMEMCRRGLDGVDGAEVAGLEADGAVRRSIDTAAQLADRCATQVWVVGADAFANLGGWHRWREMLGMVNWAVMPRAGVADWRAADPEVARAQPAPEARAARLAQGKGRVWAWNEPAGQLSGTGLRAAIAGGGDGWEGSLPAGVAAYIKERRLYGWDAR